MSHHWVGKALADGTITEKVRFLHHLPKIALGLDPNGHIGKVAHGGCLLPHHQVDHPAHTPAQAALPGHEGDVGHQ